jgi:CheY-like chemotaxis protein
MTGTDAAFPGLPSVDPEEHKKNQTQAAPLPVNPGSWSAFQQASAPGVFEPRRLVNWRGQGLVLVVDDEEGVRKIAKMILEEYGFTILTAEGGREALETFKAQSARVAAVILDLTMPQLDGLQTFQELRRLCPDVKVILSSGYSEEEAMSRFVGEGLAGFIQKPYNAVGLLEKVKQVLGGA